MRLVEPEAAIPGTGSGSVAPGGAFFPTDFTIQGVGSGLTGPERGWWTGGILPIFGSILLFS